jgi:hypothetical protein
VTDSIASPVFIMCCGQVSKEFFDPSYVPPRTTAVVTDVTCTLEELSVGGIKVAKVDLPGYGPKDVSIEVKQGWRDGARLTMSAKDILKGEACPKALQGAQFTFVVVEVRSDTPLSPPQPYHPLSHVNASPNPET